MSVTEAARGFSELLSRIYHRRESVILIKNGVPVARLVPPGPVRVTARDVATRWADLPHLARDDADRLAEEITAARPVSPPAEPPWE